MQENIKRLKRFDYNDKICLALETKIIELEEQIERAPGQEGKPIRN